MIDFNKLRSEPKAIPISKFFGEHQKDIIWYSNYQGGMLLYAWMIPLLKKEFKWTEDYVRHLLILEEK